MADTQELLGKNDAELVDYSFFWIIPSTVKPMSHAAIIKSYLNISFIITVFNTILLLPFYLLFFGLIFKYMYTILPWVILVLTLVNLAMLVLITIYAKNTVASLKDEYGSQEKNGNDISKYVVVLSYVYYGLGTLTYLYILFGSKAAYSEFNFWGILASLFMLVVFLFHVV